MLELGRDLLKKLGGMNVRIDVRDVDTVVLRGVPARDGFFNKSSTNLLVKQTDAGRYCFVGVDDDLQYTGADETLGRLFAVGTSRDGWRILPFDPRENVEAVLKNVLSVLGVDGHEPGGDATVAGGGAKKPRLLDTFGVDLTERIASDDFEPTVGREEEAARVAACVLRWGQKRLALIVGESGVGKTNLLGAVARALDAHPMGRRLVVVDLVTLLTGAWFDADRESRLAGLLDEAAAEPAVVLAIEAVEHLETAVMASTGVLLLTRFLDRGGALIGTTTAVRLELFATPPLKRRVEVVSMREMTAEGTLDVLQAVANRIAAHHHIEIDASCLPVTVRVARDLAGAYPAKAVALLDAAAARAALGGASVLGPDDVWFAARVLTGGETG